MTQQQRVVIVGADPDRRDTIARAFEEAGYATLSAASTSELGITGTNAPLAFVFDSSSSELLDDQLDRVRSRWPTTSVWTVSETARLAAGQHLGEGDFQHISCEGVLQQAIQDLGSGPPVPPVVFQQILNAKLEYESLFDSSPDPIFIISNAFTILRANRAFCDKVGRSPEDIIGTHCVELLHGILEPWSECLLAKVHESAEPLRWRMPDKALGERYECTAFQVRMADDAVCVAHHLRPADPTTPQRLNGPTTHRLGTMGELAASMIHELNNPLGAVLGFAELLEDSGSCPAELQRDLRQIQTEAWRCRRIVQNLLHLARHPRPQRRPTDLNQLVEQAIAVRSYQRGLEHVVVTRDLADDLPAAMLDPDQIEQIILNLLSNAQEATTTKGPDAQVRISTRVEGDRLVLRVSDNGPGLPLDAPEQIFDPLYTTKRPGKGTGLGLSVSRSLAEQHGGEIRCDNLEAGGATFSISLPIVPVPGAEAPKPPLRPGRILVLDDEPVVGSLLSRVLETAGHQVVVCNSADQAVRLAGSESFDTIIADLSMLEEGGCRLRSALQTFHPTLADALIVTTGGVAHPGPPAISPTSNPALAKPFSAEQAQAAVEAALRRQTDR